LSSFLEVVDRAQALLEARGRITLRSLRREFDLDDETLDDLVDALVDGQQVASRDGSALVWRGGPASTPPDSASQPASVDDSPVPLPEPDAGERRQLTVMFCDLVGSTELAQRIDPEELRDVLREYRSVCVEATKRFDGHIAQYLGDGVMVYFGYPLAHEDDAGRAVRAGLEIQRVLAERPDASRIEARIGIHTGLVVVDPSGSGEETLAMGPATNVASRIEGAAKPGTVIVSDATLSLCRGAFVTTDMGAVELKGIEAPMQLHEVERSVGVRSAIASSSLNPMVGRDREVGHLLDRWEEVQDGRGQVVLISGEPGMGKSRLIQALRDELSDAQHLWLDMQCSAFTSGSAFQPLVDLFSAGLSQGTAATPKESSQLLTSGLESMPGLPADNVIPYLLPLLSLPPSERYPLPQTSAEEQRERTLAALVQLNLCLSEQQPLVVVAEDLHWSDPSTLEYLSRLVTQSHTSRTMLVLTFRPEFRAPWMQSHVSDLKLARLSKRATREMITNAVGGSLPEPVLATIEARSDGVPLFVEELASGVVSSGVMTEQAGRFALRGSVHDLAIPATLQDSLMARLDRLSASKQVAQQAATLGREFSYELIEAVTDLDTPSLRNALSQLAAAEIVHQRGTPPDATYTFKHALLLDTAYESQLLSTRKALHRRIAAALEERFPKRVAAEPEMIARHCAAAGAHDKAIGHYQRAAELAMARFSNEEASEHYSRALEALAGLAENDERRQREIPLRVKQGQVLSALRGFEAPEVLEIFERVEALCEAVGEGPQQLPARIGLAQIDAARGNTDAHIRHAEAILRIAEPLGIDALVAASHVLIGVAMLTRSSLVSAEKRLSEALAIAEKIDLPAPATPYDLDLIAMAWSSHAIALAGLARPEQALRSLLQGEERAHQVDHVFSRSYGAIVAATVGVLLDDPELTRVSAEKGVALGDGRGFHSLELMGNVFLGWARACQGEVDEGLRDVEKGLSLADASGSVAGLAFVYVAAAHTYRMAKRRERAEELIDSAEALRERAGERGYRHYACFARALSHLELGDGTPDEAERLLLEGVESAGTIDCLQQELILSTHLARLAPRTGKVREAHDRLAGHYARLTEGFDRGPAREAKAAIDELAEMLETETAAP
jgi:class 3 adenylate cyclase/tetratricopeptide (TPR) repeat protein